MKAGILSAALVLVVGAWSGKAGAEDIDLFLGNPAQDAADLPNVLIVLDNTANWNTAFDNEKAALVSTFQSLPVDKFRVGLMTFGDPDVGPVRAAIRPMNEVTRELYAALVGSLDKNDDKASARTLSRTISESYRYLKGMESVDPGSVTSNKNADRDYDGNTSGTEAHQLVHALPDNALSSDKATTYNSPLVDGSCANIFVIYIGNNVSSGNVTKDNSSRNSAAGKELDELGGDTSQIQLTYSSHQDNYADEWARFMKQDLGVTFYTVDVDPTPRPGGHDRGMGNSDLLESMANVSDGRYFRVDSSVNAGEEIEKALEEIFSEIQATNSVFASVALPASTTTQSTFLNQVFIGMFRPDSGRKPRWFGNLKQYRLGVVGSGDNEALKLLDARGTGEEAINSNTGFITECARSYWTPTTVDSYWAPPLVPRGECLSSTPESNTPDGPVVEKGGQAYTMRGDGAQRTVYTCDAAEGAGCAPDSGLLAVYGTEAGNNDDLVDWMVGLDVDNEDERPTVMRASLHGDVIHSRPVAINYGTDDAPQVAVFYGSNDGMLRAINGNRSTQHSGVAAGAEFWTFLPPEFDSDNQGRLRANDPLIKFPATSTPPGDVGEVKDYGMDGPVVAYTGTLNGADRKFVYATLRRGGRAVYAFDVSSIGSPSLLWRAGCEESLETSDDCTDPDWTNLGQTWSPPSLAFLEGYDDGDATEPRLVPLLIMGGGYDDCEDFDNNGDPSAQNHNCGVGDKGNSIYVVSGVTGEVLKAFDTHRAVPGAVTVVPVSEQDRRIKYAYAADTGGNVYRISGPLDNDGAATEIGSNVPADWVITRIASLGCDTTASCNAPRKFLFGPDVVEPESAPGKLFVVLGSGDREKPIANYGAATAVANYAFALIDNPAAADWLEDDGTCGSDLICLNSLTAVTVEDGIPAGSDLADHGWKLALEASEQVVSSALTIADDIAFSTHIPRSPAAGTCAPDLGIATTYNVSLMTGAGEKHNIIGGGLVPSPVAGRVITDDGDLVPFCIGCGGENSAIGSSKVNSGANWIQPKGRVYWKIEQ